MIIQLLLVTAIALATYHYFFKKKYNLPPGPGGLPIFGNFASVNGRVCLTYSEWQKKYGAIFYCSFGRIHMVLLGSSKLVREVFNEVVFSGRSGDMLICILSKGKHGIVSSDGKEWMEQRRFTLRHLRDFGFGKNRMESMIMEEVNDFISMLKSHELRPIDMHHKFELGVLNSLWMITTGKRFKHGDPWMDIMKKIDATFVKPNIAGIINILAPIFIKIAPELCGWNRCLRVGEEFHKMLRDVIDEHDRTLPDPENPRDFIDAYLHEIKRTTDDTSSFYKEAGIDSLIAVVGDIFFAGSETTSVTLSWAMLYLAKNQEAQKKLQAEIDDVVGRSRQVSLSDRANLPYAEATMMEIFRKSSIVAGGVMHTAIQDSKILGYDIPKGTWIMPNIYGIHHDPDIWGDPEKFRPERFLSDDGKSVLKSEHLLSFSLGKRQCIGESLARDEVFLFTMNIFQRFSVRLDPTKPEPSLVPKPGFILEPEDHLLIMKDRLS